MNNHIIVLKNVVKEYAMGELKVVAADGVSFEIEPGEFVVMLGPSGSGKSTVLNIIGGMDRPTSGEVLIQGKNIADLSDIEITAYRRKDIGFVFQFYNLMPNLTAIENVELAAQISPKPLNIQEVMLAVELDQRLDSFPAQLSGGEQQRVAIARAVVKNPLMLLCDEPTGALDYNTGKLILKLLQNINKAMNKTVVVITHNVAVGAMADRVIKMKSGRVESVIINDNPLPLERIEW